MVKSNFPILFPKDFIEKSAVFLKIITVFVTSIVLFLGTTASKGALFFMVAQTNYLSRYFKEGVRQEALNVSQDWK